MIWATTTPSLCRSQPLPYSMTTTLSRVLFLTLSLVWTESKRLTYINQSDSVTVTDELRSL